MNPYAKSFYITEEVSNNAFNLKKRIHKRIFVPALKDGKVADVQIGSKIVFEDLDEDGCPTPCLGLDHFIKTQLADAPTYIFDNHNHAFSFWCMEHKEGNVERKAKLIHIDQHKDTRKPKSYLEADEIEDIEKVHKYVNTVLNVGNFIPPAQEVGLIDELVIIDSIASMESFEKKEHDNSNMILDIDLDFFSPDMAYISDDYKVEFIRNLIPQAKVITIATSPFFIEQKKALHFLREISDGFEK